MLMKKVLNDDYYESLIARTYTHIYNHQTTKKENNDDSWFR